MVPKKTHKENFSGPIYHNIIFLSTKTAAKTGSKASIDYNAKSATKIYKLVQL